MISRIMEWFKPKPKPKKTDGWVYVIHMGKKIYKVGCTGDIERRLKQYKTHNMGLRRIELRTTKYKVKEYRLLEKVLHRYFKSNKIDTDSNEAFRLNTKDLKDISHIINVWGIW